MSSIPLPPRGAHGSPEIVRRLLPSLSLVLLASACVTENMETGKMVPRGEQGMQFSDVEEAAKQLQDGMNKAQVMLLLGSPAEKDDAGDVWIYLPERYGFVIPARALRLEFKNSLLVDHGYRPIILGATL